MLGAVEHVTSAAYRNLMGTIKPIATKVYYQMVSIFLHAVYTGLWFSSGLTDPLKNAVVKK